MFLKSIRWRLQLWLAFLLLCTLSGFGVATFEMHRMARFEAIEEELEQQLAVLKSALHGQLPRQGRHLPLGEPRRREWSRREGSDLARTNAPSGMKEADQEEDGFSPRFRQALPGFEGRRRYAWHWKSRLSQATTNLVDDWCWTPGGLQVPPSSSGWMREAEAKGYYWEIWSRDGTRLRSSTNAPAKLLFPGLPATAWAEQVRLRGEYYEVFTLNPVGYVVSVGRSVALELEQMRSLAFWLVVVGCTVLALGVGGGWWMLSGALRPVGEISATASRISLGNLSERINSVDTSNELGHLAEVLNSMFARLEAAFAQQEQFTANASHELRTPLAVMVTEAQAALARPHTAAEYRETIEVCLATAQEMRQLAESLLELARFDARQQQFDLQPFDVAERTQRCVELVQPLAMEHGIQIRCNLQPAPMIGDADHVGRAITNLLSNALHYNRVNGEVQVNTGVANGSVLLTVADTGIGIDPKELPRIFDRFYRIDDARNRGNGHTGLGLAICKSIVTAHGGKIAVESRLGVGTTFTVTWPVAAHAS